MLETPFAFVVKLVNQAEPPKNRTNLLVACSAGLTWLLLIIVIIGLLMFPDTLAIGLMTFWIATPILIPAVLFLALMWFFIKKAFRSQSMPSRATVVGWSLFGSCGIWCAITGNLIYLLTFGGGSDFLYWVSAIFFGLPYLLACLGFVQIVSERPFTQLPRNWNRLTVWQRLSLVAFVAGAIGFAILCVYYLVILDITGAQAAQPDI